MSETIRCPFCSAKYDLRPERAHRDAKRARCVRCGNDFSIGDAVSQMFGGDAPPADAPPPPPQTAEAALGGNTASFSPEEIQAAITSSMAGLPHDPPADAPPPPPEQPPAVQAQAPPAPPADAPSKLKVRRDGELVENLTKEEVAAWVEEGKIKGHHLVAHQFSENWLEASKVPFLKPIFTKLRPPKRGLFDGLFGRN